MPDKLIKLVERVRACRLCEDELPLGPRPVLQIDRTARVLVVGQAPGTKVHETGLAFNDPSGDRLRDWMGIDRDVFYDATRIALVPMGFCYPGRGRAGDLPPIPRCAETWREPLLDQLREIRLTLAVGQYAHAWHVKDRKRNLTETVRAWRDYAPSLIPLPHPSPRNNLWLRKNPWFDDEVVPMIAERVAAALAG